MCASSDCGPGEHMSISKTVLMQGDCMSCSSSASDRSVYQEREEGLEPVTGRQNNFRHSDDPTYAAVFSQQEENKCSCSYLGTIQAATGITAAQRASVVDNMIAAAAWLGLDNDSLFMGVACLDRFLSIKPTPLNLLQPTGIACLWLAAKYEQLMVPAAANFAQLILGTNGVQLGNAPAGKQLLLMLEETVLKALNYKLASIVTTKAFKHRIMQQLSSSSAGAKLSAQQLDLLYCMTSYLTEVSLLEYQLLGWLPSQLAAAAYGYAHVLLGLQLDTELLQQLSSHTAAEVQRPMEYMCALHATLAAALQLGKPYAVTLKYSGANVCGVGTILPVMSTADARLQT